MLSFIENIGLILQRYGAVFAQGLWNTLWLSFVSVFLGTFLGILVALGKLSRHKLLNGVVSTYIEIIRGTLTSIPLSQIVTSNPRSQPDTHFAV